MDFQKLKGVQITEGNVVKLVDSKDNVLFELDQQKPIDLGLSVQWANCNFGSKSPEGSGPFFQWGDTQGWTKEDIESGDKVFGWSDYKWTQDNGQTFTKYDKQDSKLSPEDDMATVNMGAEWRLPTREEIIELLTLPYVWKERNGVMGYELTGKNGNKLFLPAVGMVMKNRVDFEDAACAYWSKDIRKDNVKTGHTIWFDDNFLQLSGGWRYIGYNIRPVTPVKP